MRKWFSNELYDEGKKDIKREKVSPTQGSLPLHSPTEPFEPVSTPFSP